MNHINPHWKETFFNNYFKENNKNKNDCISYKNQHFQKLYQYTKVKHVEDLICSNIMYLRELNELNDPFEGELPCDFRENVKVKINNKFKKNNIEIIHLNSNVKNNYNELIKNRWEEIKKEMNIVCFTENNDIIPMWSHYGDNHKGICIEYDFNKNLFIKNECFPVYYVTDANNNELCEKILKNNSEKELFSQFFLRKGENWNYEKEWRLIIPKNINNSNIKIFYKKDKKYLKFMKPNAVYLGYKIKKNDENYIKDLCNFNNIPIYKMNKDKSGYNFKTDTII